MSNDVIDGEFTEQVGTALVHTPTRANFMPVLSVEDSIERRGVLTQYVQKLMVKDQDFGVIPGTGTKPVLLKPGAEKLATVFGLTPRFEIIRSDEDWMGDTHGGEPFLYYFVRCGLWRGDFLIAEGDGSCNSWESKYRWRNMDRTCPACGKPTIIKGREEYGGGWLCFAKKGGCGAKYRAGDQAIEGQSTGRIPNPDVADVANTILKMAEKRALIAATLLAVNASEFFTQDIEDMGGGAEPSAPATVAPTPSQPPAQAAQEPNPLKEAMAEFRAVIKAMYPTAEGAELRAIGKREIYRVLPNLPADFEMDAPSYRLAAQRLQREADEAAAHAQENDPFAGDPAMEEAQEVAA